MQAALGEMEHLRLMGLQLQLMGQMAENNRNMLQLIRLHQNLPRRRRHTVWVRNWLRRREALGTYNTLFRELSIEDPRAFRNFLRVEVNSSWQSVFMELLD